MATRILSRNGNDSLASRRTAAFSLVEVLVVMVVLLVGILSILRLFPGGFLTIQRTGEISNAQALSAQQLDAEKERLALPEAIAADPRFNATTGVWTFNSDIKPDDFSEGIDPVSLKPDPYYSDINHFRYIVGESFRVPVFSPNGQSGANGSTYMLSQGPVVNQFNGKEYVNVHGAPMERIEQNYDNAEVLTFSLREGQYAIDYQNLKIAFNPRVSGDNTRFRLFNVAFDYYVSTPTGVSVNSTTATIQVNDVLPAPDAAQPQWFNILAAKPANFLGFVYGSDTCSRKFKLVKSDGPYNDAANQPSPWSDYDPFEYAWYSGQESGGSANAGVLVFNPIGHDYLVQTATGPQPLIAVVDYATFDNHILREDRTLPGSGQYEVRTSVPFVRLNGDTLNDSTTYKGMFAGNGNSADILVYNAQTGRELAEMIGGQVTAANANLALPNGSDASVSVDDANAAFAVEARTGILRFSQSFIETHSLASQTVRIFYKANRDWGMQLQKAAAHYDEAPNQAGVSYHTFFVSPTGVATSTRIYFAKCDIGKTVIVGRFTVDEGGNTNTYTNETYQIHEADTIADPVGRPYIDVKEQHPNATQFNISLTGRAVENVQGGSIKSRVIWNNGAQRYTDQNNNSRLNTRWRKVDNDTFLLQNLSR